MKPVHIMLDLETLTLTPGGKILQIGATNIREDSRAQRELFNTYILRNDQIHLREEPSVVEWWNKQPIELREKVTCNPLAKPLRDALIKFSSYLAMFNAPIRIWSNAASFDIKILEAAYKACELEVPWKYYNEMCFRTLKNLFPGLEPEFFGEKHNALDDACHQAIWAERIFNAHRLNWD